jgi:hypothetical protein
VSRSFDQHSLKSLAERTISPPVYYSLRKSITMRKGIAEARSATIEFNKKALDQLQSKGYKFVQVKGLTVDKHYDYVEPHFLVLVPMKELPTDPFKRDIYEPIGSDLLYQWASEKNEYPEIVIANNLYN